MLELVYALIFMGITAFGGIGVASLIMLVLPDAAVAGDSAAKGQKNFEYIFFAFAGIATALTLWLILVLL